MARSSVKEYFLNSQTIAFVGVSSDTKKFCRYVYNQLKAKKFNLIPVNPNIEEIDGEKCYSSVSEIADKIDAVYIITPAESTAEVLKSSVENGINQIWIQHEADSKEALEYASDKDINLIAKECILMYAEPVKSFHKFHKIVWKMIGKHKE